MMSIRTRLIVALVSLAIIPLLLMGTVLSWQSFDVQRRQALALEQEVAQHIATAVEAYVRELESEMRVVAEVGGLQDLAPAQQESLLLELLFHDDAFQEMILLDNHGQERIYQSRRKVITPADLGDRSRWDGFLIPSATRASYYSPVHFDASSGEPLMTIAVPLLDPHSGQVDGVLVAEAHIKPVRNLIAGFPVGKGESVYIVDAQGQVTAHRNPSVVLRGTHMTVPQEKGIYRGLDGNRVVLAVANVQLGEQVLVVVAEKAVVQALDLALITMAITIGLTILALFAATSLGVLTVRQIVRPIELLASTAQAIRDGDLSQQANLSNRDELGILAGAFNSMTSRLRNLIGGLEQEIAERKRAENALLESEERFRGLFERIPMGLYRTTPGGKFLAANPALAQMLRYPDLDTLLTENIGNVYADPETRKQWQTLIEGAGVVHEFKAQIRQRDGTLIWTKDTGRVVWGTDGQVLYYEGSLEDITLRVQAEDALRESEARYRSLFEHANDAILVENERDEIVDANRQACEMLGYSRTELLQMRVPNLQAPEVRGREGTVVKTEMERHGGSIFESIDIRRDGTRIPVEISTAPLPGREAGLVLSIVRDITERKQAEEALRRYAEENARLYDEARRLVGTQRRLIAAVEQAAEAVVITNPEGDIVYVNPAFERITGREAAGATHFGLIGSADGPGSGSYGELHRFIAADQVWQGRLTGKKPDGTPYTVDTIVAPVRTKAGEIVNHVATMRDVTREEQLEKQFQQAQKMEALGQLAGGIAHDFNNLLTVVLLNAQLLERRLVPLDPLWEYVQQIQETGERAASLTRQLLSFSRREIVEPRLLDLNDIVGNLEPMLQRVIGENIDLRTVPAADLWSVEMGPSQMEQVIMNLVVNARDAMPQGGVLTMETGNVVLEEADVDLHVEVQPGEYVLLAISDTGIGMSDEVQGHIFEPFFTTKQRGQGTGLGLSTVFGIVKQNGGHIRVYSEVGQGTTFKIYVPRARSPLLDDSEPQPRALPGEGDASLAAVTAGLIGGDETVLVVEDEGAVRRWAEKVLTSFGYRVLAAANGKEALEISRRHAGPIHLLLTDMVLPQMSGSEVARRLRAQRPEIRVLYISGYSAGSVAHQGVLGQGEAFLSKPFSLEALSQKMRAVLDQ